jgi:hypothetical protein
MTDDPVALLESGLNRPSTLYRRTANQLIAYPDMLLAYTDNKTNDD